MLPSLKLVSLFLVLAFALWLTPKANAAQISKATKSAVIIEFDPFEENFVVGDRLVASVEGKKKALIEISKIKGGRMLGRVLSGLAEVGMKLQRRDVVDDRPPSTASANLETVTVRFASTYVWRGVSYGRPLILGSVDINNLGLLAGLAVLNSSVPATSEYDVYLGYAINGINWSLTPMVAQYSFPSAGNLDTTDLMLTLGYRILALDYSYMPKFYGVRSSASYYKLSMTTGLGQRWKSLIHAGYSTFSKENLIGYKNYFDYKIAAIYSTPEFIVEFAWSDAARKDLRNQAIHDGTAAVVISKQF